MSTKTSPSPATSSPWDKPWEEMMAKRKKDQMADLLVPIENLFPENLKHLNHLLLLSPADWGVARNGGRRGARYAPEALLASLKKFIRPTSWNSPVGVMEIVNQKAEEQNFLKSREDASRKLAQALKVFFGKTILHLGGGHDHIYSLLCGLQKSGYSRIVVLNIDAHLDTRTDNYGHSGDPFRLFAEQYDKKLTLIQYGVHPFANAPANFQSLPRPHEMKIISYSEILKQTDYGRKSPLPFLSTSMPSVKEQEKVAYVLSLDCDVLEASLMEGTSAVNPLGLSLNHVDEIVTWFMQTYQNDLRVFGIYEYNPVFDHLSQKGAKALAGLLYRTLELSS